jgi:hypothetical protein
VKFYFEQNFTLVINLNLRTVVFRVLLHSVFPDGGADQVGVLVAQLADPDVVGLLDVLDVLPLGVTLEPHLEESRNKFLGLPYGGVA